MSKSFKLVLVLVAAGTALSACAKQEEIIYVDPAPAITTEPVFTGKYG